MIGNIASTRGPHVCATVLLLAAILAAAAYLRGIGLDWDEGRYLHPDERFLSFVESALDPVASFPAYLDTERSSLNPNNRGYEFFVYGNFPIIAIQYLGAWLERPGNDLDRRIVGTDLGTNYGSVHLLGRGVSAACDLVTTLLVYLIGARLYGRAAGLLASALYALAVLPIQQAHFFTVDAIATTFATAALLIACRAATHARWGDDVLFGLTLGAGLACKVSIFLAAALLLLGVVVRYGAQRAAQEARPARNEVVRMRQRLALLVRSVISLNVVVVVSLLTFRLLQPYAFLPPFAARDQGGLARVLDVVAPRFNPAWLEQMRKVGALQSGNDDAPPNHQWATRTPLVFPWLNLVRFGLGWPLGLAAWLAWVAALVEGVHGRARSWRHVLPVAWITLYLAWYGSGWVLTMRYFLPLYPALTVLAGWLLIRVAAPAWDLTAPSGSSASPARRAVGIAAIVLVLASSAAWAWAFTRIYTVPHSRIAASRWIYQHVPSAAVLTLSDADGTVQHTMGLPALALAPESAEGTEPGGSRSVLDPAARAVQPFTMARGGTLTALRLHDLRSTDGQPAAGRVVADIAATADGEPLASCTLDGPFAPDDGTPPTGHACRLPPHPVEADRPYVLRLSTTVPVWLAGAAIADEGDWDDAVPLELPEHASAAGRYRRFPLQIVWEDDQKKRGRLQHILDRSEYLTISSNRLYGSLARNPRRWPMTLDYYRALFAGRLGFDLEADFTSPPVLGSLRIDDQDAEEAFTVYDHPRVMIFRKRADYDSETTAAILMRADLGRVERRRADRVSDAPVVLPLPPPR